MRTRFVVCICKNSVKTWHVNSLSCSIYWLFHRLTDLFVCLFIYLFYLSGWDNWRCVHGCEWTAETKRGTTYSWDLQYGSWSTQPSVALHNSSSSWRYTQTTHRNTHWTVCCRLVIRDSCVTCQFWMIYKVTNSHFWKNLNVSELKTQECAETQAQIISPSIEQLRHQDKSAGSRAQPMSDVSQCTSEQCCDHVMEGM